MKKTLMKLSRVDLDKLATVEYSVTGASELATKGGVVEAILSTDKAKAEIKEAEEAIKNNNPDNQDETLDLPEYISKKVVKALKIEKIERNPRKDNGTAIFTPKNKKFPPFTVDRHYVKANNFNMKDGGYYVVCEDGKKGFVPAKEFKAEFQKA